MVSVTGPTQKQAGGQAALDRYGLLQAGLWSLRAGPALILLLLIVVIGLTTPVFLTSRNIGNIFSQTSVIAVVALGQLLVIVTRGIDLSVGATIALSGVVGAIVYEDTKSSVLVIAAILGTGLAVGAANGLIYVYGRVPHPFIVTLATLSIVRGLALWAAHGTLISGMPPIVQTIGGGSVSWLPYSIFVVAALALLCLVLTTRMVWGRWLYAVGGNPEAARRASIPTRRVLVAVYVLSGLAAGFGGLITAGLIDAGSPTAGDLAELDSIAAVIIGGAGICWRPGYRRQRARRGVHDRRNPQRAQPPQRRRLLPADGDRGRRPPRRRGGRAATVHRGPGSDRPSGAARMTSLVDNRGARTEQRIPALALNDACKRFGAVTALDGISLDVHHGEVLALLGDNGAGKSTLIKCLSGVHRLDSGSIEMDGVPVAIHAPSDARALGVETVYQDLALFDNLRPTDNFYAGRELAAPSFVPRSLRLLKRKRMTEATRDVLNRLQVALPDINATVGLMSGGQRQAVAVSRAAAFASKVVILDEPTAALGVRESRRVLDLILRLRNENRAVIVVSHAMDHVMEVADRAVVLRRGRAVGELIPSAETYTEIVSLIVGGGE